MSNTISKIFAREILDSRGNPTVEVKVTLKNGIEAKAMVPSGASTGEAEALELRDNDPKRYDGKGVLKAVKNVNQKIAKALIGFDVTQQEKIDALMLKLDGTPNKSKLGANAILGVSLACARVAAISKREPLYKYLHQTFKLKNKLQLPLPTFNVFNGGAHANNNLDIQEFMIIPQGIKKFTERLRAGSEIFHALKKILKTKKLPTSLGDEGGYAPSVRNTETAIEYILEAIKSANYTSGKDIYLGLDLAASGFYDSQTKKYNFAGKKLSSSQFIDWLFKLSAEYPIISLEDALAENDWTGWKELTEKFGKKTAIIGDDLFVTNKTLLQKGIDEKAANAVLIKVNQIGSLSETMETIKLARAHNYKISVSHRSGETTDDFIADLAVATAAQYAKMGSLARGERLAKWNRLAEISLDLKQ